MHEREQYRIRRDSRSAHAGASLLAWNGILNVSFARTFPLKSKGFCARSKTPIAPRQNDFSLLKAIGLRIARCDAIPRVMPPRLHGRVFRFRLTAALLVMKRCSSLRFP